MENGAQENVIAVLTTVYPEVMGYLEMFLATLEAQTENHFDLVIVNDGLDGLGKICERHGRLTYRVVNSCSTPASNREKGLRYCVNAGYEYVVFADSDDYFEPERVELLIAKIRGLSMDCVVNDVNLVNDKSGEIIQSYFSNRLSNDQLIKFEDIKHSNIFGLSNTAVRANCLSGIEIDPELIAVDWYLFTLLLLRGCSAVFTNETNTFYRQHGANTVGFGQVTIESMKRSILIKSKHYRVLAGTFNELTGLSDYYAGLAARTSDEKYIRQYYSKCLGRLPEYPFWWEEAVSNECINEN